MKHLLTLTLITFAVASAFAGDAPVDPFAKAPFNVKKALTDYEKDLLKAKENYAKEVEKIQNKAIASLSAEVANAFKKGDTTLGSELVKKIEAIKAESVTTDLLGNVIVGEETKTPTQSTTSNTQLSNSLTSATWLMWGREEWKFNDDGKFTCQNSWMGGTWKLDTEDKTKILLTFNNGKSYTFRYINNKLFHSDGMEYTVKK